MVLPKVIRRLLHSRLRAGTVLLGLALVLLPSCSAEYYRQDADEEVYGILQEKEREVFGEARPFSLEDYGGRPEVTPGVLKLDLRRSLQLAAKHSRDFQREREALYLVALTLTGDRNTYAPQFLASLRGALSGDKHQSRGSLDGDVGIDKAWKWGLLSAVRFSTSLLRSFTSDPRDVASSALSVSLVQPLLQGFGAQVAAENLTQSERNVIYAVRSFERYRRQFAVRITSSYLRALQRYDAVDNARSNLRSTESNYEKIQAQAEWGLVALYQLDQTKTSLLNAQDGVNRAEKSLQDTLDSFKLELGLPLEQQLELDTEELKEITAQGFRELNLAIEEAQEVALACRLDLANDRNQVEDAERKVVVAADNLRTRLDLTGDLVIPTPDDVNQPGKLQTDKLTYTVGFDLDLPLERTRERNTYRSALISLDREERGLEEAEDGTRLEVATGHRSLERALRSYEIQLASRDVARQRVLSTEALIQEGRVDARDLLEALAAELNAKNQVTGALIDYRIAYLEFLLALGVMEVDEDGVYVDFALEKDDAGLDRQS